MSKYQHTADFRMLKNEVAEPLVKFPFLTSCSPFLQIPLRTIRNITQNQQTFLSKVTTTLRQGSALIITPKNQSSADTEIGVRY